MDNKRRGIAGVIKDAARLVVPRDTPNGQEWRYSCGFPFQVAPGIVGISSLINIEGTPNYGYNNGNDIILFDDLAGIDKGKTFPVSRNEYMTTGEDGNKQLLLRGPAIVGFVPLQAKLDDGSAHPHAGTGFGLASACVFPVIGEDGFSWRDPERRDFMEVFQFKFDGESFASSRSALKTRDAEMPVTFERSDWNILNIGLTTAISDGRDLLLPVNARKGNAAAVGMSRWVCREGEWIPDTFTPVSEDSAIREGLKANVHEHALWMEPSLVRDIDGSLLFSARGSDSYIDDQGIHYGLMVQAWRSSDNGKTWNCLFRVPDVRQVSPVTLNRAVDGTPYLVSNVYEPGFVISRQNGRGRENLRLWPLNAQRSGIEAPVVVRETLKEFGEAPASPDPDWYDCWMADHPNAATVLLGDGKWHNLLVYRVLHSPYVGSLAISPAPQTGCYVEEVLSNGAAIPVWNF